jgi:hypothetical protein
LAECFRTWSPRVTCPSAAMTTWPLRRTQITVVERTRLRNPGMLCRVGTGSKAKKNLRKTGVRQAGTRSRCSHEYIAAGNLKLLRCPSHSLGFRLGYALVGTQGWSPGPDDSSQRKRMAGCRRYSAHGHGGRACPLARLPQAQDPRRTGARAASVPGALRTPGGRHVAGRMRRWKPRTAALSPC